MFFDGYVEKACYARRFNLLHKPDSTVPMYADESGLFVLAVLVTSANRLLRNKKTPGYPEVFVCRSRLQQIRQCNGFKKVIDHSI